jgi:hypothetical protein
MRTYAVVNDNAIIGIEYSNTSKADNWMRLEFNDPRTIGWIFDGKEWKSPDGLQTFNDLPEQIFYSKLDFMNRFTDSELVNLYNASKASTEITVWLDKFKMSEYVNITDGRTIHGIEMLEVAGLLAPGRSLEILNTKA